MTPILFYFVKKKMFQNLHLNLVNYPFRLNRFEEMRIRYERREPRSEDVRTIQELKGVIEAQDKDLRLLTEELRKMQMCQNDAPMYNQMNYDQGMMQEDQPAQLQSPTHLRKMKKPFNCDVIYEAEEEDEPQSINKKSHTLFDKTN